MSDWKIARHADRCTICGREFEPGELFVSAIFEGEPGPDLPAFKRVDACPACWEGESREPFSRWVTRHPPEEEKTPKLDLTLAKDFLVRLVREGDPSRAALAHILSLLLLRKRKVRLRGRRAEDGREVMDFTIPTTQGDVEVAIPVPEIGEEEAESLKEELGRLFGLRDP